MRNRAHLWKYIRRRSTFDKSEFSAKEKCNLNYNASERWAWAAISQRGDYDLHILCAKQIEKRKCAHLHCDQRLRKIRFAFIANREKKTVTICFQSRVMLRALVLSISRVSKILFNCSLKFIFWWIFIIFTKMSIVNVLWFIGARKLVLQTIVAFFLAFFSLINNVWQCINNK